jgi:hypothetical protein
MKDGLTKNGKVSHGICDKCLPGYVEDQKKWLNNNSGNYE